MFDLIPFERKDKGLASFMNNFEKNFFGSWQNLFADFKTDIIDKGDRYIIDAELPGFKKEEIHIDIDGDYLTVKAEHSEQNEQASDTFIRKERSYSSYHRSFNIADIKTDEISAEYKNGILKLTLPKNDKITARTKTIEIS